MPWVEVVGGIIKQRMVDGMGTRENLESRTNAKLEYARIHLQELGSQRTWNPSSPFVRAHEESCLFHAVGAKDAFLQEINGAYGLGLAMNQVGERRFGDALAKAGKTSNALTEIQNLLAQSTSWLAVAVELRNQGTHRAAVSRLFHVGGEEDGLVYYHDPRDDSTIKQNVPDYLKSVIDQMEALIVRLRGTLPW